LGGFGGSHGAPPEGGQHMANEGSGMAIG
jgi:hypothetical protein